MPIENSNNRIAYLKSLPAFDTLDYLCGLHDICYEVYGHDVHACDNAFAAGLDVLSGPGYSACEGLAFEWKVAFLAGKNIRYPTQLARPSALTGGLEALSKPVTVLGTGVFEVLSFGQQTRRARAAQQAIRSGQKVCATDNRTRAQVANAFQEEFAAKTAMACGWTQPNRNLAAGEAFGGELVGWNPRLFGLPDYRVYSSAGREFQKLTRSDQFTTLQGRAWVQQYCRAPYQVFADM